MNRRIAQQLIETADLLARRNDGNPHRIRAYRQAAEHLLRLPRPIQEIFREEGELGVRNALNVGERLAGAVREIILGGLFHYSKGFGHPAHTARCWRRYPGSARCG